MMRICLTLAAFIPLHLVTGQQGQFLIGPQQDDHHYPSSILNNDYNYYYDHEYIDDNVPLLFRPRPRQSSPPMGPTEQQREIKPGTMVMMAPPPPPSSNDNNNVGQVETIKPQSSPDLQIPIPMSMMEIMYDYYEYGGGGPDYYPGPPGPPGGGWYPPPPPPPYPHPPPSYPVSSKPPAKGKPSKPKPKPMKPKPEEPIGGGWPSEPIEEKPKDKLSELKDKWNSLIDKLKIKDKDKGKDKDKEKIVSPSQSQQGYGTIPSSSLGSGQFQLEHLPGWNAPPQRNPSNGEGGQNHGVSGGGGGEWFPSSSGSSSPPRRPILEIWLGPWFRRDKISEERDRGIKIK